LTEGTKGIGTHPKIVRLAGTIDGIPNSQKSWVRVVSELMSEFKVPDWRQIESFWATLYGKFKPLQRAASGRTLRPA
jgi:hypothetical protein